MLSKDESIQDESEKNIEFFGRFKTLHILQEYIRKFAESKSIYLSEEDIEKFAKIIAAMKICDRKNNLKTEILTTIKRTQCKIHQTDENLVPISRQIQNPVLHGQLIQQIVRTQVQVENAKRGKIVLIHTES